MTEFYRLAADVTVGVHYAFLIYLIVGGFLAWRWPITIGTHLAAAVWGALIVFAHVECPLTALQNWLRERAGQAPVSGFINVYVRGTFYPADGAVWAQGATALVIVVSWVGFATRMRARRRLTAADPGERRQIGASS